MQPPSKRGGRSGVFWILILSMYLFYSNILFGDCSHRFCIHLGSYSQIIKKNYQRSQDLLLRIYSNDIQHQLCAFQQWNTEYINGKCFILRLTNKTSPLNKNWQNRQVFFEEGHHSGLYRYSLRACLYIYTALCSFHSEEYTL